MLKKVVQRKQASARIVRYEQITQVCPYDSNMYNTNRRVEDFDHPYNGILLMIFCREYLSVSRISGPNYVKNIDATLANYRVDISPSNIEVC